MNRWLLLRLLKFVLVFCFILFLFKAFLLTSDKPQNPAESETFQALRNIERSNTNPTTQGNENTQETIANTDVMESFDAKVTQTMELIESKEPKEVQIDQKTWETQKAENVPILEALDSEEDQDDNKAKETKGTPTLIQVENKVVQDISRMQEQKAIENLETPKYLKIFEERRIRVQNYCNSLQNPPKMPNNYPSQLLVLKERKLVWCPSYKAGTSTWMTYLAQLSNRPDKNQLVEKYHAINLGHKVAPKLTLASWQKWRNMIHKNNQQEIKFIVVRHPFERLVSAFRDKLERSCEE